MAEYSGNVGDAAETLFASGALSNGCTIQNSASSVLWVRVSSSDAAAGTGFVLDGGYALSLRALDIPAGAKVTAIRETGKTGDVYAVGA
jgi:hypothetical protein